nr:sugar ABC transporter permease [Bacillota bacterium]
MNYSEDSYVKKANKKNASIKLLIEDIGKHKGLYLMVLPAVIFFLIFSYTPMVGAIIAFKNYNVSKGIFGSPWAGFDNFKFFFMSGSAWTLTKNTMLYNLAFLVVNV